MRLFDELNIETQSDCNRRCPTCLRQSYPVQQVGRFEPRQLPAETVRSIIDQAAGIGFRGWVCLQHFNEPLLDDRIADLGRYAKSKGVFHEVYINTNGDMLNPDRAAHIDGAFDRLNIALYGSGKLIREQYFRSLFRQTRLTFTQGEHVVTHHSPYSNLQAEIDACLPMPCERECQMRCIISYTGEMLLCCDDIAGEWQLGNIHDTTLHDLWYGEKHAAILKQLSVPGGREAYDYCRICPRPNTPWWSTL